MKNYLKLIVLLVPLSGVIVLGFNNCARYGELEGEISSSSTTNTGGGGNTDLGSSTPAPGGIDGQDSQALGIPIALLSAEQSLSSMLKVTNITTPDTTILTEYTGRYGSLAAGNDLNMANGPLMLGATSLAGTVCNAVVTSERNVAAANRSFFGSINFAAGVNSVDDNAYRTVVRGFARSFWGRSENAQELEMILAFKTAFVGALAGTALTNTASTSNLMVGTCAAMLSSLDAMTY